MFCLSLTHNFIDIRNSSEFSVAKITMPWWLLPIRVFFGESRIADASVIEGTGELQRSDG